MGSMIKDNLPILAGVGAGLTLPALFPALAGAGAAGIGTTMPAWAGGAGAGLTGLAPAASTTTLPSILTNPWMRFGMQMFDQDDPRRHLPGPQPQVPFPRDKPVFDWDTAISTPVEDNTALVPPVDTNLSAQLLPNVHVIDQADPRRHLSGMQDLGGLMGAYGGGMPNLPGGY